MILTSKDWQKYVGQMEKLQKTAGEEFLKYADSVGYDTYKMQRYAFELCSKYGEASSALSAELYDELASAQGAKVKAAVTSSMYEQKGGLNYVTSSLRDAARNSTDPTQTMQNIVERIIKQKGADTIRQNAKRDGAEFAWVPSGDTCSFCITLASRGWQKASNLTLKGDHARHIHTNCDCQFCVRFDGKSTVEGYDPDKYLAIYNSAEGNTSRQKINSLRRMQYQKNKDAINAAKRAQYALRHPVAGVTQHDNVLETDDGKQIAYTDEQSRNEAIKELKEQIDN